MKEYSFTLITKKNLTEKDQQNIMIYMLEFCKCGTSSACVEIKEK